MKTCANCGQPMKDQDLFCANCGAMSLDGVDAPNRPTEAAPTPNSAPASQPGVGQAPQYAPPVAPPPAPRTGKGKGGWKAAVVAVVAVGALAVAGVGITGALKDGDKTFADVQKEFLLDSGTTYVKQLVEQYDAMTNLSTDLTITVESPSPEYDMYLEDSALHMGIETGLDSFALDASLELMGSDVIGGVVALDDGMLTLALPEITDNRYVLDLKQMIYEATGIEVRELALPELSEDTMVSLVKTYFNTVLSAVTEDNVTVEKNEEIELPWLGESVDGTLYVFQPTAQDVEKMLLKLADALEEDEELRDFILSLTGDNLALVEAALGVDDLDALLQEGLGEAANALRDSAEAAGQTVEDAGLVWTVGYADGRVCYQEIRLEEYPDMRIAYESVGDEKSGRNDVFYVQEYADSMAMLVETEYTKKGGVYNGEMTMSQWDEELFTMRYEDVDEEKKSALGAAYGTYSMTMNQYGTEMNVDMSVTKGEDGGTDHRFAIRSEELYYTAGFDELAINIHSTDKKASIELPKGQEVDITSLTDGDLEELAYLIEQHLMETLAPIMGMDGYYY